jgi:thiol-disulfide isomerase/thioredoxin
VSVLRSGWFLAAVMVTLLTAFVNFERNARSTARAESPLKADKERKPAPEFELKDADGKTVRLSDYKGRVVLLDFWATWCGPCRAQHPLYEEVKQRFRMNSDVAFVSVNTDENRALVAPFVKDQKWSQSIYFEDGLVRRLDIKSIPTTIVLNRHGEIVSRLNGFVPDRFVDMLSDRIQEALQ